MNDIEYELKIIDDTDEAAKIRSVTKIIDQHGYARIKWDCRQENNAGYDLVLVVKTTESNFEAEQLQKSDFGANGDIDVFIYSKIETWEHVEKANRSNGYSYYVYSAKIKDEGKFLVLEQNGEENRVFTGDNSEIFEDDSLPQGTLHYRWKILWLPWRLNKMAYLSISKRAHYYNKDLVHYTVADNRNEIYSLRLTNMGKHMIIPLHIGETVEFNEGEIIIEEISLIEWIIRNMPKALLYFLEKIVKRR